MAAAPRVRAAEPRRRARRFAAHASSFFFFLFSWVSVSASVGVVVVSVVVVVVGDPSEHQRANTREPRAVPTSWLDTCDSRGIDKMPSFW